MNNPIGAALSALFRQGWKIFDNILLWVSIIIIVAIILTSGDNFTPITWGDTVLIGK